MNFFDQELAEHYRQMCRMNSLLSTITETDEKLFEFLYSTISYDLEDQKKLIEELRNMNKGRSQTFSGPWKSLFNPEAVAKREESTSDFVQEVKRLDNRQDVVYCGYETDTDENELGQFRRTNLFCGTSRRRLRRRRVRKFIESKEQEKKVSWRRNIKKNYKMDKKDDGNGEDLEEIQVVPTDEPVREKKKKWWLCCV